MLNIIDVTFLSRLVELSGPPGLWSISRPELLFESFSLSFRVKQSFRPRSANFHILTEGLTTFYMQHNQSGKRIAALRDQEVETGGELRTSHTQNAAWLILCTTLSLK